jgi:hypothetical protein
MTIYYTIIITWKQLNLNGVYYTNFMHNILKHFDQQTNWLLIYDFNNMDLYKFFQTLNFSVIQRILITEQFCMKT